LVAPDAGKFTIGATTGALSFVTAPNFEAPTDVGGNNVYDVTVQASDGQGGIDTQAIAVSVTPNPKPAQVQISGDGVTGTVNLANFDKGAGVNYAAGGGNKTINASSHNDYIDLGSGFDKVHLGGGNDTVKFGTGTSYVWASPGNDRFIFDKTVVPKANDVILNFKATDGTAPHDTIMLQNYGAGEHIAFHGYADAAPDGRVIVAQVYDVVNATGHVDGAFKVTVQLNHDGTYHQLGSGDVSQMVTCCDLL